MALIASGCVRQAGNFDPITSLGATDWVNYAVTAPFSRRFCRGLSALWPGPASARTSLQLQQDCPQGLPLL